MFSALLKFVGSGKGMDINMIVRLKNPNIAAPLFDNWQETLIWSCLQNIMGAVYADDMNNPHSAMALLGDFCFFAGRPDKDLVNIMNRRQDAAADMPVGTDFDCINFMIMVTQDSEWDKLIKDCYGDRAKEVTRYAIKKDTEFDKIKLQQAVNSLSAEYELRLIDKELYDMCLENEWSRDLVSQFINYEMYEKLGLGVAALKDGELVSGASSYSRYNDGIEIEIDTHKDYRRKGLAYACGAKLILECLDRGLYPSWDAQNMWSVALAQKLGYCYDRPYLAYEVVRG